jgi:hypothetical protein
VAAESIAGASPRFRQHTFTLGEAYSADITAVRWENGTAEDALLEKREWIWALGALERVWDELDPAGFCCTGWLRRFRLADMAMHPHRRPASRRR